MIIQSEKKNNGENYGSYLLGIGLLSYVEKRPKIWEAHVLLNVVERDNKINRETEQ